VRLVFVFPYCDGVHIDTCPVPIYDGRRVPPFRFTAENLDDIKQFPLYHGGKEDPLRGSIVTVGYTFSTWLLTSAEMAASFNIMFLIVIGKVREVEDIFGRL
jgi:hypothetical protein